MGCLVIMDDNWNDPDVYNTRTESSEKTNFPADNIENKIRRTKVWRSDGYWEVTSSNNSLVFRETTGVDLFTSVQVGTYTSTTDLMTALKTALETAGASTYTCEREATTHKIKITSDGLGGGGIFELRWATSTALATLLGFDTTNDTGALSYIADSLVLATEEWIKWDLGIPSNPKGFAITGQRATPLELSPSSTLKLQGNTTDAWSAPEYEATLTYYDTSISLINKDGLHTGPLRFWRLLIDDTANPNGYVEVAQCHLGDIFQGTRGDVQFPFQGKFEDTTKTTISQGGQSFSIIKPTGETFTLEWFGCTISEKESLERHFNNVGLGYPFFVSYDPNAAFSSDGNYYVRYVKYAATPAYSLVSPENYRITMTLREEL